MPRLPAPVPAAPAATSAMHLAGASVRQVVPAAATRVADGVIAARELSETRRPGRPSHAPQRISGAQGGVDFYVPEDIGVARAMMFGYYRQAHAALQRLGPPARPLRASDIAAPGDMAAHDRRRGMLAVVPSLDLSKSEMAKIPGAAEYGDRLLPYLLLLQHPGIEIIFHRAGALDPDTVDYWLRLIPATPAQYLSRLGRLYLLPSRTAAGDTLAEAMLARGTALAASAQLLAERQEDMGDVAGVTCCHGSEAIEQVARALAVPLLESGLQHAVYGTKAGARALFEEVGVPLARGVGLAHSVEELTESVTNLLFTQPDITALMLKLNESFSGEGNATLTFDPEALRTARAEGHAAVRQLVAARLPAVKPSAADLTWEQYAAQVADLGIIAEELLQGQTKSSPSLQGLLHGDGRFEVLSTHEQILGGASGQIYEGARLGADSAYRTAVLAEGSKVLRALSERGAVGFMSVDFFATRAAPEAAWRVHALEINLRKGGTTHPLMALKLLTGGKTDLRDGVFRTARGEAKCYRSTDVLRSERFKRLTPKAIYDELQISGLQWSAETQTGVVPHLLNLLPAYGKLGCTAIGNNDVEVDAAYDQFCTMLERLADRAAGGAGSPA